VGVIIIELQLHWSRMCISTWSALDDTYIYHSVGKLFTSNFASCQCPDCLVYPATPIIRHSRICTPESFTPMIRPEPTLPQTSSTSRATKTPAFLKIPLEIRLQIYYYVLKSHAIHHAHLSVLASTSILPPYAIEQYLQSVIPKSLLVGCPESYMEPRFNEEETLELTTPTPCDIV